MSRSTGLTLVAAGLFAAVWATLTAAPEEPSVTPAQLERQPLTIAASNVGDFGAEVYSWYLSVSSAGQAELTIETVPERTRKRFEVGQERFAAFRKALAEQHFFQLSGEYGEHVPDGSTSSLTVAAGQKSRTVNVHFLMNWVHGDRGKLREPARAVQLLVLIRGWFEDPKAVDLRKYDRMVLDAIK